MPERRKLTNEEYFAEAKKIFGDVSPRYWKYVCTRCGHVQSGDEMMKKYPESEWGYIQNSCFMSCEGRLQLKYNLKTNEPGCDWTLGGLFQIHKTEVMSQDGTHYIPVFEFYKGSK